MIPTKTIRDRMEVLRSLVTNGDVMDLGMVDSWRAKRSSQSADSGIGIISKITHPQAMEQ